MNENLILISVFVGVLIVGYLIIDNLRARQDLSRKLKDARPTYFGEDGKANEQFEKLVASDNEYVQNYFDVLENRSPDSVEFRMIQAGFFGKKAPNNFRLIRIAACVLMFMATLILFQTYFVNVTNMMALLISAVVAGVTFILANFILERLAKSKETTYRKLFPDLMDMLVVCVDAGLSIEAAVNRVAREFMVAQPDFGTHLNIMMLEVRAGRRLRDALANLAGRINIEEAKSLAVLFRQSEELGSSVTKTLRIFSSEMRQMRMIRAEEKANSLPIKMLFPLAFFLFPTNLIIVLVPIIIRVGNMFLSLTPN